MSPGIERTSADTRVEQCFEPFALTRRRLQFSLGGEDHDSGSRLEIGD
jgi:hypothetical protein